MSETFIPKTLEQLREGFPPEIDHMSASQITQLLRCPEQYRQVRLLGRRVRPAAAIIWGRADHDAIATHFAQQVDDGVGLSVEEVQDAFADYFHMACETEDVDWGETKPEKVLDHGTILAGLYRRDVAPYVNPVDVEVSFEYVNPMLPVRIDGRVDVETEHALIERKTAARRNAKPNPEWVIQGRIYQLVKQKEVRWHQSVKSTTNTARLSAWGDDAAMTEPLNPLRQDQTLVLVAQAIDTLKHLYTTYGPDTPWPGALSHPWACNYCGFRASCPWHF